MTCTSCGREVRPGDLFCAACGHELAPPTCPLAVPDAPNIASPEPAERLPAPVVTLEEHIVFEEDPGPPLWEARLAPAAGLSARNMPDAAAPVVADFAPDTQLLVLEECEQWARVSVESGWSGWVDARRLVDPDLPDAPATAELGRS